MRIYLDLCCLKRPFDDQRQDRVRLEAEAVAALVERGEPALAIENGANPREDRRLATALWMNGATVAVGHTAAAAQRARDLEAIGFAALDALHLAYAEAAGARWFVTYDDDLLRLAKQRAAVLRVAAIDPVALSRQPESSG